LKKGHEKAKSFYFEKTVSKNAKWQPCLKVLQTKKYSWTLLVEAIQKMCPDNFNFRDILDFNYNSLFLNKKNSVSG
jgi:hypothetical protein